MDIREQLQQTLSATYSLERELTGGGMSHVFLARENALGRHVVVKVLPPEAAAAVSIDRFKREIAFAARLQHPHIVPLLAAGEMEGIPYFTMPYIEGESLRVRLARHGELPIAEGMRLLREVASALAYAHGQGVIHRDIKPDNVLLSGGSAMVTDFGVAKALAASSAGEHSGLTSLGVALGTPAYMAPEQASADPAIDHRADIYAFGVLAYETLTGQTPFSGRPPHALLMAHVTETPEPVTRRRETIPPALGALIMRCLEKRPADRIQTAQEIVRAFDDITTPSGGTQPMSAAAAVSPGSARRRRVLAVGVLSAVAAASASAAWLAGSGRRLAAMETSSIAVMQLANATGDTAMRYFIIGTTDEITSALDRIPGLRVASRSATDGLGSDNARTVGSALGVSHVLEGRLRREGDAMALTVQLTKVADGLSVWSETYRGNVKDAFVVQAAMAAAIARQLKLELTPAQQAGVVRHQTQSARAHDLYLRGRYAQSQFDETSLRRSIEYFESALAEDPAYAAPWAGIADSWSTLADDFISPRDAWPKAMVAIQKGLAIDSTDPALLVSVATAALFYERDLPKALRYYSTALTEDSTFAAGRWYYALALAADGQRDSARAIIRRLAADSLEAVSITNAAFVAFYYFGDTALGSEVCSTTRGRANYACRVYSLAAAGRYTEQLALFDSVVKAAPILRHRAHAQIHMVNALAKLGRTREARALARAVESGVSKIYFREDDLARMWASVGDADRAYAWLLRADSSYSADVPLLGLFWQRFEIRNDPRIAAFIDTHAVGKRSW